ncbi:MULTISPECIES: LysR family transcriptional regulator [Streptomyces]|uniref:LysR family transcriptional regulator n=1 Tax=Streptomyces TaxID=1883 RepID=UPI000BD607AF|nr:MULTISPECIES: LysR family transcriptional regulator [Streptomyces]MCX5347142.1 LysR family transcriptional regulator [Streptomyces mirabilis]QDN85866.1 LysR family transcriptional regulator [Streptomyces sp. RLB3-6]QDO06678.1 LysR family transcriptional regulator [Streptomyces sp. S1D4-23]QDO38292.1 LysR family transcriptional regulator [Streptomyces sp. RLB3-17]SOE25488.1 DNA-binding transcriptional regulator, LysR family [Streptomyces sp. OK228]
MPHSELDTSTAPLDISLLRTFLAVHRAGSFTAAARLLGLSQPTVTTQMRSLEEQLGRELFERQPRGVVPTSVADELAAEVAAPLDALAAVADRRGAGADQPPDPVHLAGPAELLCTRVLPALAPLTAQGVRLRVTPGLTDELLDGLRGGRFDLVIATTRPRGRTLTAVPLMDEEFVLVAAPSWAERIDPARVAAEGPAALHGAPLVTYAEDLPIARRYWRHVFGVRLTGQASITVPDLRGVLAAVVAGAGITVLPRYLCLDALASGALVPLLSPEEPPINTGYLTQRPGASDNPHVAVVRERLLQAGRTW